MSFAVQLVYVGRIAFITPSHLGDLFKEQMVVTIKTEERPSPANKWQSQQIFTPNQMWWTDKDPLTGSDAFCFMAGYGPIVQKTLQERGYTVQVSDRRPSGLQVPLVERLKGLEFRGRQLQVLSLMAMSRTGVIDCPVGYGKSWLIGQVVRMYPEATIVVTVPAVQNAEDLYRDLRNLNITNLGMVGGGKRNPDRVTVAVTHSLHYCDPAANLLILDEAHMAMTKVHLANLSPFKQAKFLALTATAEGRGDGGDGFLTAYFGPVLIKIPYEEAVESGNVVPLTVELLPCREGRDVTTCSNDTTKKKLGIWMNRDRNETIAARIRKEMEEHPDHQILVMVETIVHAYMLQQLLPEFEVATKPPSAERVQEMTDIGAFKPDSQKVCTAKMLARFKEDFTSGKLRYCIANKIWSRGVNFKDLNVLVRADGLASQIDATQVPGRLSRLGNDGKKAGGLLIDCVDLFARVLLGRSLKRIAVYRSNKWQLTDESEQLRKRSAALYRQGSRPGRDQEDL